MTQETITIKPSALPNMLRTLRNTENSDGTKGRPACVWGPPGSGKSFIARQFAKSEGCKFLDWRAVLFDPSDIRGFPYIKDGIAKWAPPEFLPREENVIIAMEELNRAPTLVQNAFLQLVYDRQIGEYRLPDDTYIIALCNDSDAGVNAMSLAMKNRFIHLNLLPDFDDWHSWANLNGVHHSVIGFLKSRPELFYATEKTANKHSKAEISPRTWEFVSQIASSSNGLDENLPLYAGAVGHGAAIEYLAHLKNSIKVDLDAIIKNPSKEPVPKDMGVRYAVASGLARKATSENFSKIITYLYRMSNEFNVMCVRDAVERDQSLIKLKDFEDWVNKFPEIFAKDKE